MMRFRPQTIFLFLIVLLIATPVLAQPAPQEIRPGSPLTIDLTSSNPIELVYPAEGPQTITLIAHSLDGNVDTTLKIFTPEGRLLAENDDLANSRPELLATDSIIEALALPVPGPYRIVVDSFTGINAGPVEVSIETADAPVIGHPAQLPDLSHPVPPDVKYVIPGQPMRIHVPGGALDFLLIIEGQPNVTISASRLGNVFDPLLEVRDPQGSVLESNDDFDTGTRNARIVGWQPPGPGVYTVRVSSFTGTDAGGVELFVEIR